MDDRTAPDAFDDINAAVGEEWKAETTPYERVRYIISHTYDPVAASTVAEQALTATKTARKHLETLASDGYVEAVPHEAGGKRYQRAPESLVVEQAAEILTELSREELAARIAEMRDTIQEYQTDFGVESPEKLSVKQGNDALSDAPTQTNSDASVITDWQTTRRNLAFATAALSIANARKFVVSDDAPHRSGAALTQ
jgi:DNA-binding MarR family transcriptional regulator